MKEEVIYLDYAATTPVDQRVLEAMLPYFIQNFGNAASNTHSYGKKAKEVVDFARGEIAGLIDTNPNHIVFTSGSTEAINTAIKGVAEANLSKGSHIITCVTEHKAVLDTCEYLESIGVEVTYLPVDESGLIDITDLKNAIRPDTILVSIMYANNETGVIQPISEIGRICREQDVIFMTDATQAVGKISVSVERDNIDILCFSGHKLYAPKGIGAMYVRKGVNISPIIHGGGHENGLRSGTLNVPSIVGLGKACEIIKEEMNEESQRLSGLRAFLEQELAKYDFVSINGEKAPRLPHIANILFKGYDSEVMMGRMPQVAVSSGSACTSAIIEPSPVLQAMGLSDESAHASLRFSLGKFTSFDDLKIVLFSLAKILNKNSVEESFN